MDGDRGNKLRTAFLLSLNRVVSAERFLLPFITLEGIVSTSKRDALAPLLAAAGVRTVAANRQVRRTSTLLRLHIFLGRYDILSTYLPFYY